MLSKPIVIVAALLFSASTQANSLYAENKTKNVVTHQVIANPQTPTTPSQAPLASSADDKVLKTESKGEFEHEIVVFLAQGMGGFMAF